jgi:cysteine desulfurase
LMNKTQTPVQIMPVTPAGMPEPSVFQEQVGRHTSMLTLTLVNSETGVVNTEVRQMAQAAAKHGALVFLDACQAVGRMGLANLPSEVDMVSISAHKFGGPRGVGALWVKKGVHVFPAWGGGFQQGGLRSGTCSPVTAAGMTQALLHTRDNLDKQFEYIEDLRQHLDSKMRQIQDLTVNFGDCPRVCNTSSYLIKGVHSKVLSLLLRKRGIYISDGTSGLAQTSEVSPLMSFLHSDEDRYSNIRISLGRNNTREEVDKAVKEIALAVKTLRKLYPEPFPGVTR